MKNPNDKRRFGELQAFKNLLIFAHDNGAGQSGAFIDADINEIRKFVVQVMKERPDVRELLWQCVQDSSGIILPSN